MKTACGHEIRDEDITSDVRGTRNLIILAVILLAALALRLYRLNSGLWLDEMLTYVNYARMPFRQIISTYDSENQNLLYSLLARAFFNLCGQGTWSLRLPAVLFGVGSIWALYLLGRQVASTQEALLSAALLAFSYHHVWFSQNARGYTGLLFWTLLASWLLLRGLSEGRRRLWLLYGVTAALGVYTHLTMLFVIVGHFISYLILLVSRRNEAWSSRWAGPFLGFGVAGFLTLLLHVPVLPQMLATVGGTEQSVVGAWKSPLWTAVEIIKGLQIGFLSGLVALVAVVLFGAGLLDYMRKCPILVQLLVIPPVLGAAVVISIGHHLWPRFFFFAMGFAVLVLIRGVMVLAQVLVRVSRIPSSTAVAVGTGLCVALIVVSFLSATLAYGPKQDYFGALDFIESRKLPGDAVVTVGLATFAYTDFYQTDWQEVKTLDSLDAIRASAKRTWLVYTFPPEVQSLYPEIMASIESDFDVVAEFPGTVGSGTIIVCRADASTSQLFGTQEARWPSNARGSAMKL